MLKTELLAPAGDCEKAVIAFKYGADAVFLGAKAYSLRSQASNFFIKDIQATCKIAKKMNKKVYVAVNVICHNALLKGFPKFINELSKTGINGLIVADPFIIDYVSKNYPKLDLHLSTQQSVTNSLSAKFWNQNNICRVVLARETSINELKQLMINNKNKVEIEYFVHGAVCISYSGRCMMSNNWSLRDANVGGCAQSCRWKFQLMKKQKNNKNNKIYTNNFTMSPKDMMLINEVKKLIDMGISSFKIEGRMKSLNYVATVVKGYREAIDFCLKTKNKLTYQSKINEIKNDLKYAENRLTSLAYSKGYTSANDMLYHDEIKNVKQKFAFIVIKFENPYIKVVGRNNFKLKQKFTIFGPKNKYKKLTLIEILDKNKNKINVANKPMETYYLKFDKKELKIKKDFIGRIE